ncbi:hypothetical protein EST38_g3607 [Candolleomyces aberdarensis]|uniref:Protein SMG7 n=1 Tax=Candolleomyces aberdarensis TaxID=2316362 RepID=A0A4Q2DQ63_9AGAR|nr:hypothetical protein EST38_g3607 [Candolleomyces aberdarensis]
MSEDSTTIAREAKSIHQSLKELLKTKEPYDRDVEFQRKNLRKRYLNLLLLHPYANDTKDVETSLWMQTSYAFIASYRHRISIIDRAIQGNARQSAEQQQTKQQQNQKQNAHGPVEYRKLLQRFRQFLAEEEKFWIQLVLRMYRSFDLKEAEPALTLLGLITDANGAANGAKATGAHNIFPQESSSALTPGTEAEKESRLSIMNKAFIYLGDFARYKELYNEAGGRPRAGQEAGAPARRGKIRKKGTSGIDTVPMARNYDRAQQRYEQARLLLPSDGNASHQLAIVASYVPDRLGSLTHYYRALCVKHPFEPAAENMATHMTKTLQIWNRQRQERERMLASTPVTIANQVDIFKNRVVVLHALWRNPIDKEVKEQERRVYEEFHRLVGARDLSTDTICNVIILSQGALYKHRMIRDSNSASSRHEAPRTPGADILLEWRLFGHLLDMHIALLEVGKHELKELPSMDNVDNDPAQRITATFRRILPPLRIASKWLRSNLTYAMQDPEFKAYQQKEKSKRVKTPQKGKGKISGHSHHTVRFWNRYTQFMTSLANAFPGDRLLPLSDPLEEDIDMRGFLPLKKAVGESSLTDSRTSGRVPNEEQLMRISDLLADARAMIEMDNSPITYEAGVFKLKESVLEPRLSRHRSNGPNAPEDAPHAPPAQEQTIMEAIRDSKADEPPNDDDARTEGTDEIVNEVFKVGLDQFEDDEEDDEIVWNPKATSPPISPGLQATPIVPMKSLTSPLGHSSALTSPARSSLSPKQATKTPIGSPRASAVPVTAQDLLINAMNVGRKPSATLVSTVDSPRIKPTLLFGSELAPNSIWSASHDEQPLKFAAVRRIPMLRFPEASLKTPMQGYQCRTD